MLSHKNIKKFFLIFIIFFISPTILYCPHPEKGKGEAPKIGNFALPGSQQQGPLVSLGQNIIGKNQLQAYLFTDFFKGTKIHAADAVPSILFGITDAISLFFNIPVVISYREDNNRSSGLSDLFMQFEYAFYMRDTSRYSDAISVVLNMTFPTGSTKKEPPTGFGSPSFLLGGTFSRLYIDWYAFISGGSILTTEHKGTKFGNQFLYQAGLGRNIISVPSKLIFSWLVEIDGAYAQKDRRKGVVINPMTGVIEPGSATDPDSGGTVVYVTPSLWFSTQKLIIQTGFGFPVVQKLTGNQKKNYFSFITSIGWLF